MLEFIFDGFHFNHNLQVNPLCRQTVRSHLFTPFLQRGRGVHGAFRSNMSVL